MNHQIKSKERVATHGEVFTSQREVNAMLDLVKQETERIDSRFLEPACGDGNFLIEILRRKLAVCEGRVKAKQYTQLQYEQAAVQAVSSIYGIELLADNVEACRKRLLDFFTEQYHALFKSKCKDDCIRSVEYLLSKNIIQGNALTYKRVDEPDQWIHICEWGFFGKGMVNRCDYLFSELIGDAEPDSLQTVNTPAKTHPLIHFLKLSADAYHEQL